MSLLELYEEKWYRKAVSGFRTKWAPKVKAAPPAYIKGVARVTGLPESTVAASFPARNYREFAANAEKFVEIAVNKIESAHSARKWAENYKKAFTITG